MGTELFVRGLGTCDLPERWVEDRPDDIAAVHAAHAAAGAGLVLTCTFNLAAAALAGEGRARVEAIANAAVALARRGAPAALVAGAVGPARPAGGDRDAATLHAEAARALASAGADLLWLETLPGLADAALAAAGARAAGLPFVLTFALRERDGHLVDDAGTDAAECLRRAAALGAAAVGLNCALPGQAVAAALARAVGHVRVPLVAKPSAGLPGRVLAPNAFAAWLGELARAGASLVGGCCGASAAHLAAARDHLVSRGYEPSRWRP
jgi:5-methyltetrahydrofolate--homocysteine methyltransferase